VRRDPRYWRRSSANLFSPKSIPGLALWLDSARGITLNGSTVSAWTDQSGAGNNVSQGTGSQQPTFVAADASFGGRPSLSFASASVQCLLDASFPGVAQPWTMVTAFSSDHSAAGWSASGNTSTGGGVFVTTTSTGLSAGTQVLSANAVTTPQIVAGVANGASSALYINNSQVAAATGNAGSSAITTTFVVAALNAAGAQALNGKVANVLLYSGALTTAQLKTLFAYLGARYGIAVS
jgi:hypothetical protein